MTKDNEHFPEKVTATEVRSAFALGVLDQIARDTERINQMFAPILRDMAPFVRIATDLNRQLAESGVLKQMKYVQDAYAKILTPLTVPRLHLAPLRPALPPVERPAERFPVRVERIPQAATQHLQLDQPHPHRFDYALILTGDGDLFRASDPNLKYIMGPSKLRLRVLRAILSHRGRYHSALLAADLQTTQKALYDAILAINRNVRVKLELPKGTKYNLIIGRKGSGYELNFLYPIIERA